MRLSVDGLKTDMAIRYVCRCHESWNGFKLPAVCVYTISCVCMHVIVWYVAPRRKMMHTIIGFVCHCMCIAMLTSVQFAKHAHKFVFRRNQFKTLHSLWFCVSCVQWYECNYNDATAIPHIIYSIFMVCHFQIKEINKWNEKRATRTTTSILSNRNSFARLL